MKESIHECGRSGAFVFNGLLRPEYKKTSPEPACRDAETRQTGSVSEVWFGAQAVGRGQWPPPAPGLPLPRGGQRSSLTSGRMPSTIGYLTRPWGFSTPGHLAVGRHASDAAGIICSAIQMKSRLYLLHTRNRLHLNTMKPP